MENATRIFSKAPVLHSSRSDAALVTGCVMTAWIEKKGIGMKGKACHNVPTRVSLSAHLGALLVSSVLESALSKCPYFDSRSGDQCDVTRLVAKGAHTRVERTVVQRHRKRNELGRATREILESSRIGRRIVIPVRGNKGKGKGQSKYRSERGV